MQHHFSQIIFPPQSGALYGFGNVEYNNGENTTTARKISFWLWSITAAEWWVVSHPSKLDHMVGPETVSATLYQCIGMQSTVVWLIKYVLYIFCIRAVEHWLFYMKVFLCLIFIMDSFRNSLTFQNNVNFAGIVTIKYVDIIALNKTVKWISEN